MSLQLPPVLDQPAPVGAHLLGHYVHDSHSDGAPYYSGSRFESFRPTDPNLRRECLEHLLIANERHLQSVLAGFADYYNRHRPHQGRGQLAPDDETGRVVDPTAEIRRRKVLGGLINEYSRGA